MKCHDLYIVFSPGPTISISLKNVNYYFWFLYNVPGAVRGIEEQYKGD